MSETITYREFLLWYTILHGGPPMLAVEAVSSWAIDHPEIDLDETATWDEWMRREFSKEP